MPDFFSVYKKLVDLGWNDPVVSLLCSVYLIDHAWTYRLEQARSQLENNEALLARMSKLMEVDASVDRVQSDVVEDVLREMWK